MKLINDLQLTEREFIELTIEWGYKGEEFECKAWQERGCLKSNDGTHKKLISKGKTHFEIVTIKGTGSKRIYTLSGLKETPSERINGNSTNGKKETEDDVIIREYFFNQLSKRISHKEEGWAETINLWGSNWINQLEVSESEWEAYRNKLIEVFSEQSEITDEIINKLIANIEDNLKKNYRSLAVKSIERLEREERIETELEFYQAYAKGSFVGSMIKQMAEDNGEKTVEYHNKLDEDKHSQIVAGLNELLEPYNMNYQRFKVVSAFPQFAIPEERKAIKMANQWLFDEHSIDYIYSRIRIYVKDPTVRKHISKEEVKTAFINRIIKNTNARMKRKDYKSTHKFQASFYRLSMFMLLDLKKVEGLKEAIKNEKLMINENIDACQYEYALKYGEQAEQPEVYGFGEVALDQPKKIKQLPFGVSKLFDPVDVKVTEEKAEVKTEKQKANPRLIDIAAIGLEDNKPPEKPRKPIPIFGSNMNGFIVPNVETPVSKDVQAMMDDENYEFWHEEVEESNDNITKLSLWGFEKWA